ncbi:phage tail sheath subtilisin-like domain-containing protein [Roseospira goensis]|uniref:Tail sheath protein subtilisin-like domain-containing protein n=1 Tax=Roseospira goensis TaxID=391922 RepID=A0A7W6S491_9PROT|nr:phage tail sheath subtilisin-like domain-containing protein [Roseospira goensis]MBB4287844.1 hypothetical protein [Roseospira goensis]
MDIFLHGIETQEKDAGNPRFVATIDSGIIFLVGTAPDADDTLFPLNQPRVMRGYTDLPAGLGNTGTLSDHLDAILTQAGRMSQTVYFTRVEEGADTAATMANVLGSRAARTGLHALSRIQPEFGQAPKLIGAPGFTSVRPTDGVASVPVTEGGTDYTTATVAITGDGIGATATAMLDGGAVSAIVVTNPGIGYTTATATVTGDGTGATATTTLGTVANPVAAELAALCQRYRACTVVSGPNGTDADAVQYRNDFDSDRMMVLDPFVKVAKDGVPVSMPADAMVLGLQARVDYEEGFWVSPSNHVLNGVLGTHRPIEHSLSDRSVESQYLNSQHVSTVVRSPTGGWKLWGNRVAKADPLHVFWPVRRAHDVIVESIEIAHEPYLDKPFSKQILVDIAETVNRALRRWQAMGATLGGRVWLDPALNTAESMASGLLYVHYDGEAPAPIEHLVFVFNRNTGYYTTVLADAAREIARMASAAA